MRITARRLVVLAVGLILAIWLVLRLIPSDENQIRGLIQQAAEALEDGNLDGAMKVISLSYRDGYGLTYGAWRVLFQRGFDKYVDIRVWIRGLEVQIHGDEAQATFSVRAEATVAATTGDPDRLPVRDVGTVERARLHLNKEPWGWRVVSGEELRPDRWGL